MNSVYTCIKYINYLFLDVFSIVNVIDGGVARCVTSTLTNYTVTISALVSNVLYSLYVIVPENEYCGWASVDPTTQHAHIRTCLSDVVMM